MCLSSSKFRPYLALYHSHFGQRSAHAKIAYDPDGSTALATLISRASSRDFGHSEPAASLRVLSQPRVHQSIAARSPRCKLLAFVVLTMLGHASLWASIDGRHGRISPGDLQRTPALEALDLD